MKVKGRDFVTSKTHHSHDVALKKSREEGSLLDKPKTRLDAREFLGADHRQVSRSTLHSKRATQARREKANLGGRARPVSPSLSRGDRELASSPNAKRMGGRFFRSISPSQRKGQSREWNPDLLSTSSRSSTSETMGKLKVHSRENHGTSFDRSVRSTSPSSSTSQRKECTTVSSTKEAAEARQEKRLDKESEGGHKSSREPPLDPIRAITPTKGRRQKNEVSIEFVAVPSKREYSTLQNNGRRSTVGNLGRDPFCGANSCNASENPKVISDFSKFLEEQGRCNAFDDLKEGILAIPEVVGLASQQMTQCCHAEIQDLFDDGELKPRNMRHKLDPNLKSKPFGIVLVEDENKNASCAKGVMKHPSGKVVWSQYQGDKEDDEGVELEAKARQRRSWWRLRNAKSFGGRRASSRF
jgi:hypothetical protein